MADDIDIEDHDLMDNSLVKGMFPDLSIVKTELIFDDESEGDDDVPGDGFSTPDHGATSSFVPDSTTDVHLPIDSRAAESPHIVSSTQDELTRPDPYNNRIILGTKRKPIVDEDIDLEYCYKAAVLLEDWGQYLLTSDSYCQECETLFATVNALDAHKMAAHSYLVAVEPTREPSPEKEIKTRNCFVCKQLFTDEAQLIKHIYQHIESSFKCDDCQKTFLSYQLLEAHTKSGDCVVTDLAYQCDICRCYYRRLRNYETHMSLHHNRQPADYAMVPIKLNCHFCRENFMNVKSYHTHIASFHGDIYFAQRNAAPKLVAKKSGLKHFVSDKASKIVKIKVISDTVYLARDVLFSCAKCDVHLTSFPKARVHNASCNGIADKHRLCTICDLKIGISCVADHFKQHALSENFTIHEINQRLESRILNECPKCEVYFTEKNYWEHLENCVETPSFECGLCEVNIDKSVRANHEELHKRNGEAFIFITYMETAQNDARNAEIPTKHVKKYTMYVCKYCNSILTHRKSNLLRKHFDGECQGLLKALCRFCGLTFTNHLLMAHQSLHRELEDFTLENFRFHRLQDDKPIMEHIPQYAKCSKCGIHGYSSIANNHHCSAEQYKTCQYCKLKFNMKTINLHMAFHRLSRKPNKESTTVKPVNDDAIQYINKLKKSGAYILYYCDKCNNCLHYPKHIAARSIINCKEVSQTICSKCGLMFSYHGMAKHKRWHNYNARNGGELRDIKMFNLQMERIAPRLPDYPKCVKCDVHFHSKKVFSIHKCPVKDQQSCKLCDKKYWIKTYKIHMAFHNYPENKPVKAAPLKTGASNGRIALYYCDECKCYFPNATTHKPQTCGLMPTRYCSCCGLCFTRTVYEAHKSIHENRNVTVKDYIVHRLSDNTVISPPMPAYLACNLCGVLFYSLSYRKNHDCDNMQTVKCELCDKTYSSDTYKLHVAFHRFNEKAVSSGKSKVHETIQRKYTLYQCAKCECCFRNKHNIAAHITTKCRGSLAQCTLCKLMFKDIKAHRLLHVSLPHFVRRNMNVVPVNSPEDLAMDTKLVVYQCSVCQYVAFTGHIMKQHKRKCTGKHRGKYCYICGFVTSKSQYNTHTRFHQNYENVKREDLNVVPFHPDGAVSKGKAPKKQYVIPKPHQFYQCKKCKFICFNALRRAKHKYICNGVQPKKSSCKKCSKCGLPVRVGQAVIHQKMHSIYPNMTPENINLVPFDFVYRRSNSKSNDINQTSKTKPDFKMRFYQCRDCLKPLHIENTENLSKHLQNHIAECSNTKATFSCDVCQLYFTNRTGLIIHSKLHTCPPYNNPNNIIITKFDKSDYAEVAASINLQNDEVVEYDEDKVDVEENTDTVANITEKTVIKFNKSNYDDVAATINLQNDKVIEYDDDKGKSILGEVDVQEKTATGVNITEKTVVYYQCRVCTSCMCIDSTQNHLTTNCHLYTSKHLRKCPICHYNFYYTGFSKHLDTHALKPLMTPENIKVVLFGNKKSEEIYRCDPCDVHFLTKDNAMVHLEDDHNITEKTRVCRCGLAFMEIDIDKHERMHHPEGDSDSDTLNVTDISTLANKTATKRRYNGEPVKPLENIPKNTVVYYQCRVCTSCMFFEGTQNHLTTNCHLYPSNNLRECPICHYNFHYSGFSKHLDRHALNPLMTPENIKVVLFGNKKSEEIYRCDPCDVHFLTKDNAMVHLEDDHNIMEERRVCRCGLAFMENDIDKHERMHHPEGDSDSTKLNVTDISAFANKTPIKRRYNVESVEPLENIPENTVVFYQCRGCTSCMFLEGTQNHLTTNCHLYPSNNLRECPICHYNFHYSGFSKHLDRHALNPLMTPENIKVVLFGNKKSEEIYRCDPCDVHFLTMDNAMVHLEDDHNIMEERRVCHCGLAFMENDIDKHERMHHPEGDSDSTKLNVTDISAFANKAAIKRRYNLESVKPLENIPENTVVFYQCRVCTSCMFIEGTQNHLTTNCHLYPSNYLRECPICHYNFHYSGISKHLDRHALNPLMTPENIKVVLFGNKKSEEIYRCDPCNVHFLTKDKAMVHLDDDHNITEETRVCRCGLAFMEIDIDKHERMHHPEGDSDSTKLDVTDISIFEKRSTTRRSLPLTRTIPVKPVPSMKMYECDCKLVFLCRASVKEHQSKCTGHCDTGLKCSKCDLYFDEQQLLKHSEIHHLGPSEDQYSIFKYPLTTIGSKKTIYYPTQDNDLFFCGRCNVNFVKMNSLQKHASIGHNRFRAIGICKFCGLRFSTTSLEKHIEAHHSKTAFDFFNLRDDRYVLLKVIPAVQSANNESEVASVSNDSNMDANVSNGVPELSEEKSSGLSTTNVIDDKEPTTPINVVNEREITKEVVVMMTKATLQHYECKECHVIFLNKRVANTHAADHTPLTDYDFIECKVCKLNFVLDSLKMHMAQHKNNEFSIDTVKIIVFDPANMNDTFNDVDESNNTKFDNDEVEISKPDIIDTSRNVNEDVDSNEKDASINCSNEKVSNEKLDQNCSDKPKKIVLVYK